MAHTSTPWLQVKEFPTLLATQANPRLSLLGLDQEGAACFHNEEDCEFAVRAVNSHAKLVSELDKAGRMLAAILNELSPRQKTTLHAKFEAMGVHGEGLMRTNERDQVLWDAHKRLNVPL